MHPPRNIFVGTIHAFLNRFVLSPYATLLGELPDEKLFMAVDIDLPKTGKKATPATKAIIRNKIIGSLLKKGVVPYEQMVAISADLVDRPTVRSALGRRLQFLFVDEFQDVDITQLRVFEAVRKEGKTTFFAVGDPEQYISSFTYGQRGVAAPKYLKIPFFRFAEKAQRSNICGNRRSCVEIVKFLNQFHTHLDQESLQGARGTPRVFFLRETSLSEIIERFRAVSDDEHDDEKPIQRLYLGLANATFDEVREQYGLVSVCNNGVVERSVLAETLEFISKAFGVSQRRFRENHGLHIIAWRKIGLRVLWAIRRGYIESEESIRRVVAKELKLPSHDVDRPMLDSEVQVFLNAVRRNSSATDSERCSSIHKAKGLEGDAVLVVARTVSELRKWVQTDSSSRATEGNDACRVGYVAFSRAKEVLCIACKQPIDDSMRKLLVSLGVSVV